MITIILRKSNMKGSYGFNKTIKNLREIEMKSLGTEIEIVMVNNIDTYKEYYPIQYLRDEEEFLEKFNELYENSEKLSLTEYILKKIEKYKNS